MNQQELIAPFLGLPLSCSVTTIEFSVAERRFNIYIDDAWASIDAEVAKHKHELVSAYFSEATLVKRIMEITK